MSHFGYLARSGNTQYPQNQSLDVAWNSFDRQITLHSTKEAFRQ